MKSNHISIHLGKINFNRMRLTLKLYKEETVVVDNYHLDRN